MKVLKGFVYLLAGGIVLLVIAGVAGYFTLNALPQVAVTNSCEEAIALPTIPTVPDSIAVGGSVSFPVIFGPGTYSLYEDGGVYKVDLPRALPGLGETITVSQSFADPDATFAGQTVTIPMEATVEMGQSYALVVCAEGA